MPARRPKTPRTRDQIVAFDAKTDGGKERLLAELARREADVEKRVGKVESGLATVETDFAALEEEVDEIVTSGPVPSSRTISTTGGLTGGGDLTADRTLSILDNGVTLAKLADIATQTFLGRSTSGTGDPEALTQAQATALLNVFTSTLKGLVPASGGGTANFLRADGNWIAPNLNTFVSHGTGLDGALVFDGTTAVLGMTPTANVYDLGDIDRDIFPSDMTVDSGVTVKAANRRIIGSGTCENNGVVECNGNDASGSAAGTGVPAGFYAASGDGHAGVATVGGTASGSDSSDVSGVLNLPGASTSTTNLRGTGTDDGLAGNVPYRGGGGGGGGGLNSGGDSGTATVLLESAAGGAGLMELYRGRITFASNTPMKSGGTGGGAGGASSGPSGGGGGSAGTLYVEFKEITGTGVFSANGGEGGGATGTQAGGGGGGPGSIAAVICGAASGSWTVTATGGAGGAGTGAGSGGDGGAGADGFVICPVTP